MAASREIVGQPDRSSAPLIAAVGAGVRDLWTCTREADRDTRELIAALAVKRTLPERAPHPMCRPC